MRMKNKKKNRFSKVVVSAIFTFNVLFTIGVLYVFLKTGNEPMTLIGAWFGFTTGELWLLSGITKNKIKKEGIEYE